MDNALMTAREIAPLLKVAAWTVRDWARRGDIPYYRTPDSRASAVALLDGGSKLETRGRRKQSDEKK